jgi:hypothetical protein
MSMRRQRLKRLLVLITLLGLLSGLSSAEGEEEAVAVAEAVTVTVIPLSLGVPEDGLCSETAPKQGAGVLCSTQYRISVPPEAVGLEVRLQGEGGSKRERGGDLDLLMRSGHPIEIRRGRLIAESASTLAGADERIGIAGPQAGNWYIAILNWTPEPQAYRLTARVILPLTLAIGDSPKFDRCEDVAEVSQQGRRFGMACVNQYVLNLPEGVDRLRIEVKSERPSAGAKGMGPLKLLVRSGRRIEPGPAGCCLYDFQRDERGNRITLMLDSRSSPPLQPGVYYLALVNFRTIPQGFSIRVSIPTAALEAGGIVEIEPH